jgi:hypothetical protein
MMDLSRGSALWDLAEKLESMGPSWRGSDQHWSTGWSGLDHLLPGGGFRVGSTVEWLGDGGGSGVLSLAIGSAYRAAGGRGGLVVMDRSRELYPAGMPGVLLSGEMSVLVRPGSLEEELWAWEQSLCSAGVAVVVGVLDGVNDKSLRRLTLAAERGGTLGFWVCLGRGRDFPCWADLQLQLQLNQRSRAESDHRRTHCRSPSKVHGRLSLTRAKKGRTGGVAEVIWDEESGSLSVVSTLGDPAARVAGASVPAAREGCLPGESPLPSRHSA